MALLQTSLRTTGPSSYLFLGAIGLSVGVSLGAVLRAAMSTPAGKYLSGTWTPSPRETLLPNLSGAEIDALPYPPDVLPGVRDVATPYGSIHVFEWGPEDGEKVLLMHGITTPCVSQSELADALVAKGYRVMLFDYFGRGYSDSPNDVPFDMRLFTSQILLVLASSPLPWTGNDCFHLMAYSLGGAVAASFAGYFPHLLRSVTIIAGGGLMRGYHVSWRTRLLYSEGIFPEPLLRFLVRTRLTTPHAQILKKKHENSDVNGGGVFNEATLSRRRPGITVSRVVGWQLRHHQGFIPAFISSMRNTPLYDQQEVWSTLGRVLKERRESALPGLKGGKALIFLGDSDPVILKDELIQDATAALTEEGFEVVVLDGGHEIAMSKGPEITKIATEFWRQSASQAGGGVVDTKEL